MTLSTKLALTCAMHVALLSACSPASDKDGPDLLLDTDADADGDGDGDGDADGGPDGDAGLPVLGGYNHSADSVTMTEILGPDDLNRPMDLAFHPSVPDDLWIVNQNDHSMTIATLSSSGVSNTTSKSDATGAHFMAKPASLAFGTDGKLATIHEEDETTPYTGNAPGSFMGPSLWTSETAAFDAGHSSHYDMLHNSPNGVGIEWETDNVYWVFDGYHSSLTRYDFVGDHGAGGTDHSDADVRRYVEGEVSYEAGVVSHLAFDSGSNLLYVADSGNGRIAVLDITSGTDDGVQYGPNYDGGSQQGVDGADLQTLVDDSSGLEVPSGIALYDDMIFVVDHATSIIYAFDLDGEVVDWLETGIDSDSLMGIEFDSEGRLYVADASADKIIRISAQ